MKKLMLLFAILLIAAAGKAQTVSDANASMHATATQGIFSCTYTVVLSDTSNVSDIEIKLGTSSGNDDLLSQDVVYDNAGSLPQDWTYSRTGKTVVIGAGNYSESNIYFGQVRVKSSGTWGDPFQFITN